MVRSKKSRIIVKSVRSSACHRDVLVHSPRTVENSTRIADEHVEGVLNCRSLPNIRVQI